MVNFLLHLNLTECARVWGGGTAGFIVVILIQPMYRAIFNPQQMPIMVDLSPHNFKSLSHAGPNSGVLACKISVSRQKIIIICATRA